MPTKGGPLTGDYEIKPARREYRAGVRDTLKERDRVRKTVDKMIDALEAYKSSVEVHCDWLMGQETHNAKELLFGHPTDVLSKLDDILGKGQERLYEGGHNLSLYYEGIEKECPFCDYKGGRFKSGMCPKCNTDRDDFIAAHPDLQDLWWRRQPS